MDAIHSTLTHLKSMALDMNDLKTSLKEPNDRLTRTSGKAETARGKLNAVAKKTEKLLRL
jgi:hypothetical protein